MKEQTLLRIALIASLLGLAILLVVARSSGPANADVSSIDSAMKGNQVKIIGTVEQVRNAGESQILVVSQPSTITVFVSGQPELRKGDTVEVIGRVDEYKEKQEIVADRIRVLSS